MSLPISPKKAFLEWRLYLFIVPSLLVVGIFSYFPAVSAIYYSLFRWSGGEEKAFIGWENWGAVFQDTVFWNSFITLGILIVANGFKLIPTVGLAVLIHRLTSDRWQYRYRVLVALPLFVPGLVTLLIWKYFFDPNMGLVNKVLDAIGFKALLVQVDSVLGWGVFQAGVPVAWLEEPALIIPSLIFLGFPWVGAIGVLVLLAKLQSINPEVYEAADLDGVGPFQKFRHLELPHILPQIRLLWGLMILGALPGYGLLFLLLGEAGGPDSRGMVPGLWMFNRAFVAGELGYASALGVMLMGLILLLTLIYKKSVRVEQ